MQAQSHFPGCRIRCALRIVGSLLAAFVLNAAAPGDRFPLPPADPAPPWGVLHFAEDSGSPSSEFHQVHALPDGSAWVAASDGLRFYDGYQWTRYDTRHGLPSLFVRSVLVTRSGDLWVGTDRGAGIFSARGFDRHGSESWLAGPSVGHIRQGPDGSLWFACDRWPRSNIDSGVTRYFRGEARSFGTTDGLPSRYVFDVVPLSDGTVLAITDLGMASLVGDRWQTVPVEGSGLWIPRTPVELHPGHIVVTGNQKLWERVDQRWTALDLPILRQDSTGAWKPVPDATIGHLVAPGRPGHVLVLVSLGPWHHLAEYDGTSLRIVSAGIGVTEWNWMESLDPAPGGALWICGDSTLDHWVPQGGEWKHHQGHSPEPVAIDGLGSVWFLDGTNLLQTVRDSLIHRGSSGRQVIRSPTGTLWTWGEADLIRDTAQPSREHRQTDTGIATPQAAAFDSLGRFWIGGGGEHEDWVVARHQSGGWLQKNLGGTARFTLRSLAPDAAGGVWCFGLHWRSGILVHLNETGHHTYSVPDLEWREVGYSPRMGTDENGVPFIYRLDRFHRFDPATSTLVPEPEAPSWLEAQLTTQPHPSFLLLGRLGGVSGTAVRRHGKWEIQPHRWYGTSASLDHIRHRQPLSADPTVFGNGSLLAFDPARGLHHRLSLPTPGAPLQAVVETNGSAWVQFSGGLLRHTPDHAAPRIRKISGPAELHVNDRLSLTFDTVRRAHPSEPGHRFRYLWRLDEGPWTGPLPWPSEGVPAAGLTIGSHQLHIRAVTESGDVQESVTTFPFRVLAIPLQEEPWFPWAAGGTILAFSVLSLVAIHGRRLVSAQNRNLDQLVRQRTAELQASLEESHRHADEARSLAIAAQEAARAKDAFLDNVTHELRTPMNGIIGMNELLLTTPLNSEQSQYAHITQRSAESLLIIIDDLLDISQLDGGRLQIVPEPLALRPWLQPIADRAASLASTRGLAFSFEVNPAVPDSFSADSIRLRQVLDKLLSNAVKFTKAGEVRFQVSFVRDPLGYDRVRFEVIDSGIGIDPAARERLFRPFSQADDSRTRKYGGTGLGLAISQRLVERMGGQIQFESTPGSGSRFWFELAL
jgi:signal transduction histidine kinase